ncbi:isocitrate/isopropylmalate dehydrogenase family protein [Halomonas denitrificans]|uniref:isocitrate/isopropylmalate dehydrogenase family protein n=1 Tax=Halomonas denitrificans TaxID=370769 RepID=UPI001CD603C4|nr:isocitrate/isopropylmalate dehydrogenase family protein [Halomonas denitrificans]MCA0973315.1 isocitrate/isopropylmalate dehydrogenase family protein [Halomonas denitrificans]
MSYRIATIAGDGIGPEVTEATVRVLDALLGPDVLMFEWLDGGAGHYQKTGEVLPAETLAACRDSHAILHGAAGLPGVTYDDGTEVGNDLHLKLRFGLDLYANVRPIRLLPGVESPLRHHQPGTIDYVIVRENTEGLYASRGAGVVLRDEMASDSLVITRKGTERVARFACELSRRRQGAPRDGKHRVTVCDKANILRSYAFFRRVCDQVSVDFDDIERDYAYVDAMTVHLVKRPDFYDVIVAENLFGDIISDLGAATVGGMGVSPSAELGDRHGLFQGAHGSAPDIAGQDAANPIATLLSGAMMLEWLASGHHDERLSLAAERFRLAIDKVLEAGLHRPREFGGQAGCRVFTEAVLDQLGRT